jgi:hypothetical protein
MCEVIQQQMCEDIKQTVSGGSGGEAGNGLKTQGAPFPVVLGIQLNSVGER